MFFVYSPQRVDFAEFERNWLKGFLMTSLSLKSCMISWSYIQCFNLNFKKNLTTIESIQYVASSVFIIPSSPNVCTVMVSYTSVSIALVGDVFLIIWGGYQGPPKGYTTVLQKWNVTLISNLAYFNVFLSTSMSCTVHQNYLIVFYKFWTFTL